MLSPILCSTAKANISQNPDDHVSLLCAWLALVPQALVVSYTTLSIAQREVEVLLMFAGQLACEAVNWVLKRCFKQQRPKRTDPCRTESYPTHIQPLFYYYFPLAILTNDVEMYGKGYGMPSSHAQFVAFFAVYFSLWIYLRARHLPTYERVLISVTTVVASIAVSASRIYLSYHTRLQVACGYSVGVVFALAWFGFTTWLRETTLGQARSGWGLETLTGGRKLWDWILWATQIVYVKDLLADVDLVRWEWEVWNKARGGEAAADEGVRLLLKERKRR